MSLTRCEICSRRMWPWQCQVFSCGQDIAVHHCGRPHCYAIAELRIGVAKLQAAVQELSASLVEAGDRIVKKVKRRMPR